MTDEILYREARLGAAKGREVAVLFSSESPVWDARLNAYEVLDHSNADFSRLNDGAAVLLNHDPAKFLGSVVKGSARIDAGPVGRAKIRLSTNPDGEQVLADLSDGIDRAVSLGYQRTKIVDRTRGADGNDTIRFGFHALEVSIVSIPADPNAGVGRSIQTNMKINYDASPADGGGGTPDKRVSEILSIADRCERHKPEVADVIKKRAREYIAAGHSVDQFRQFAFETAFDAKPLPQADTYSRGIGMNPSEIKRYSLIKAIRQAAGMNEDGQPSSRVNGLDGIELEAHQEMTKRSRQEGRQCSGFWVPMDVLGYSRDATMQRIANMSVDQLRTLTTNVFTSAGAFVGEELHSGSFIELLRNTMVVMQMGARSLTGLRGDVAIPRQSGGATAYWLPEGGTTTLSTQTVGQLALKPHRLSAATAYDKQLLIQSSVDVESFVRGDLAAVLAVERDRACLNGLGAAGEPLGIINTTGLSTTTTLTNSATITYAHALTAESNIATNNALAGSLGWVTSIATRAGTKATQRFSSTDTPVWTPENKINGYPAMATNQMPSTCNALFGNWADFIVADWDGLDVTVDPYSLVRQAQIQVVINQWMDCGLRHAASFTKGNI